MGLFGGKKTYVSSTIYNLAGDIEKRPSYIKTLVASYALKSSGRDSIGDTIRDGYLKGPGLKLRNFALWAKDNYTQLGVPKGNLYGQPQIDPADIEPLTSHDPDQVLNVQRTYIQSADYASWAEQWMLQYHPELLTTDWYSDYNDDLGTITITFEDMSTVEFTPTDFDKLATYLYVLYNFIRGAETGDTVVGPLNSGAYPSTSGWTLVTSTTNVENFTLEHVVKTTLSYSDGRPDEVSTTSTPTNESYNYYRATYTKSDYQGSSGSTDDQLYQIDRTMLLYRDGYVTTATTTTTTTEDAGGGVTRTRKIEDTQDSLNVEQTWRINTREKTRQSFSPAQMLIYRLGSGGSAALDAKLLEEDQDGFYFPFIPVRHNNRMIDETYYPDVRIQNEKAYRKLTGSRKYGDDIVEKVGANSALPDMDYVYLMLGTSLNTKENAAKKYMFEFFDRLRLTQQISSSNYNAWLAAQTEFNADNQFWIEWRDAQNDPANPLYGTPMPDTGMAPSLPNNEIRIRSTGAFYIADLDISITWQTITRTSGTGKITPTAKIGDCIIEYNATNYYDSYGYTDGSAINIDPIAIDGLSIRKQLTNNTWARLNVTGLVHRNYIYQGKYVETTAQEAMNDSEESGFLVPLHYDVFKSLSLVDSTQLSTACTYLVINSYKVVKKKFFQTGFFKILLVAAVIAITIATSGTGSFSFGILGSSAAIGATLGLAGTAAFVVGAVANVIAAMILTRLITIGAIQIFGDKLGIIIGTIASLAALQIGTTLQAGMPLSSIFSNLMRVDSIIMMTSAVGNGVAGYIQFGAMDNIQKAQELQKNYEEKSKELSKLYEDNIGYGRASLDPLLLLSDSTNIKYETASAFIQRTLMTGSDIAELSINMLNNFADITLSTELN